MKTVNDKLVFDAMRTVAQHLDSIGLKYWLSFGTLLGLYRDGHPIKGDTDVDFLVRTEDVSPKRLKQLVLWLKESGYNVKCYSEPKKMKLVARKLEYDIVIAGFRLNGKYRYRHLWKIPERFFGELGSISYCGHRFRCHYPIEEFLEYVYSNWSVPMPKYLGRKLYNKQVLRK